MNISISTDPFGPAFAADWERACRDDAELDHLGGHANARFAVQAGAVAATLQFVDGKLDGIRTGADAAEFTLRAPTEVWERFLQAVPPAPYHHVLAMKMRVPEFSVIGDEQKLLQSAHLVRRSLELARWVANGRAAAALRPEGPLGGPCRGQHRAHRRALRMDRYRGTPSSHLLRAGRRRA